MSARAEDPPEPAHGMRHFDYVIVGGGAAGCVVAARLAQALDATVCLVEAGRDADDDPRVRDYRQWGSLVGGPDDFYYGIEPQERGNGRVALSSARMLGGGTSHNTVLAFRPPEHDLQRWVAGGAEGWNAEACAAASRRVHETINLERAPDSNPVDRAFVEAAQAIGFPLVDFAVADFDEGVGWLVHNILGGERHSASGAYLGRHEERPPNLAVLTEAPARSIVLDESRRAVGIDLGHETIVARRDIIVCAGAVGSAKLLLLSGIGPTEHLREVGVEPRIDLPGVGENLQDHIEGLVMFAAPDLPASEGHGWNVSLFARSGGAPHVDIQIHFGHEGYDLYAGPAGYAAPDRAVSFTPNVARPQTVGTVRLRSSDPNDPPVVDPRYLTDPDRADERALLAGMRLTRKLAQQPALARWLQAEVAPGPVVRSDEQLLEYLRATHGSVFHPVGTCRMGRSDDPLAVVDPRLRVRGVTGLRVADSSIMPRIVGVNPCLSCMLIGERAAEFVISENQTP